MSDGVEIESALIEAARQARYEAYAPYSGYRVGAAILDANGRVWTGANVENISFGATLCAERVAVGKMASAGAREVSIIAVATKDGATPCGICRQTLLEFTPDSKKVRVLIAGDGSPVREFTLSDLIPHGFGSDQVARTER